MNIFKFKVVIYFTDGTQTFVETYDDNIDATNSIFIDKGCYVVYKKNPKLESSCLMSFPIKDNIKELAVYFGEENNEF